jgi:hypothetical protein
MFEDGDWSCGQCGDHQFRKSRACYNATYNMGGAISRGERGGVNDVDIGSLSGRVKKDSDPRYVTVGYSYHVSDIENIDGVKTLIYHDFSWSFDYPVIPVDGVTYELNSNKIAERMPINSKGWLDDNIETYNLPPHTKGLRNNWGKRSHDAMSKNHYLNMDMKMDYIESVSHSGVGDRRICSDRHRQNMGRRSRMGQMGKCQDHQRVEGSDAFGRRRVHCVTIAQGRVLQPNRFLP